MRLSKVMQGFLRLCVVESYLLLGHAIKLEPVYHITAYNVKLKFSQAVIL